MKKLSIFTVLMFLGFLGFQTNVYASAINGGGAGSFTPVTTCASWDTTAGGPTGGTEWQSIQDWSKYPNIDQYRIQWWNGNWSDWYVPTVNDFDAKTNYDGSWRYMISYKQDHNWETRNCSEAVVVPVSSITVTSPNGGETYTAGQQITVTWDGFNFSSDSLVEVNLYNGPSQVFGFLAPNGTRNDGLETFTLDKDLPTSSNYEIIVGTPNSDFSNSNLNISDKSDNKFTINAAPVAYTMTCANWDTTTGGPTGGTEWQSIQDWSKYPSIEQYRIQWWNGNWSEWYTSGKNDLDAKTNYDGSWRYMISYKQDHNWETRDCLDNNVTPVTPAPYVNLKINGSHNPGSVEYNSIMDLSWDSNLNYCTWYGSWAKNTNGEIISSTKTESSGKQKVYATTYESNMTSPYYINPMQIGVQCWSKDGSINKFDDIYVSVIQSNVVVDPIYPINNQYPKGCTSSYGYSTYDGGPCNRLVKPDNSYPAGCTSNYGYSSTTGLACGGVAQNINYPAGCSSNYGYSTTTGLACNGTNIGTLPPVISTPDNSSRGFSNPGVGNSNRTIRLGHKGSDVQAVQQSLINKGFLSGIADGSFGRKTYLAVKAFQVSKNLKADGAVGPLTRSLILDSGTSSSVNNSASTFSSPVTTTQRTTN